MPYDDGYVLVVKTRDHPYTAHCCHHLDRSGGWRTRVSLAQAGRRSLVSLLVSSLPSRRVASPPPRRNGVAQKEIRRNGGSLNSLRQPTAVSRARARVASGALRVALAADARRADQPPRPRGVTSQYSALHHTTLFHSSTSRRDITVQYIILHHIIPFLDLEA